MDQEQLKLAEELLFSGEKKPSFAKMLYFGMIDSSRIYPFPLPDKEKLSQIENYKTNLKEFVREHIDPDWIDRNSEIPQSVIEGLGELGFMGFSIPKEYGGLGMSQYAYCQCMEIIAQQCGATAVFVNAHQSIGIKSLLLFGTESQKETYLPDLARGKKIAAFSLTESEAGSDAAGIQTEAYFDEKKQVWIINGNKQWTTNGSIASVLTLMAKIKYVADNGEEDERVSAFLVTPDMPGFKIKDAALDKVGIRGTQTTNISLENLEVPKENIIGKEGKGLRVCLTVLDYGRITFGATCSGIAKDVLERTLTYAKQRKQFKKSLTHFPLIKKKIALMSALSYAMDASTYLTAGIIDRGDDEVMLEAAILKVFNSESLWTIIYEGMQIFGGRSFFTDLPLERMMRDARLNMIGEGANEVLRAFIGAVGMRDVGVQLQEGLCSSKKIFNNPFAFLKFSKQLLNRLKMPYLPLSNPDILKDEAVLIAKLTKRFGWVVINTLRKYKESIVDKQFELERIATAAIALYSSIATLYKIDHELGTIDKNNPDLESQLQTAKFYCSYAYKQATEALDQLFNKGDKEVEALSDLLTR